MDNDFKEFKFANNAKTVSLIASLMLTFFPLLYLEKSKPVFSFDEKITQKVTVNLLSSPVPTQPLRVKVGVEKTVTSFVETGIRALVTDTTSNFVTNDERKDLNGEKATEERPSLDLTITPDNLKYISSQKKTALKQLIEEDEISRNKKNKEQFSNDVHKSLKDDCLKKDYGMGVLSIIPLAVDIYKSNCPR